MSHSQETNSLIFIKEAAKDQLNRLILPDAFGTPLLTAQLEKEDDSVKKEVDSLASFAVGAAQLVGGKPVALVPDALVRTPVHAAARAGHERALGILLDDAVRTGASVSSWWRDCAGRTPMHDAVLSRSWPCVLRLWEWCRKRDDVFREGDSIGNTPMHYCEDDTIWRELQSRVNNPLVWTIKNHIGLVPWDNVAHWKRLQRLQSSLNFRVMPDCKAFDFVELGLCVHNTLVQYVAGDKKQGCRFGECVVPQSGALYEAVGLCVEPNPVCLPRLPKKPRNVVFEEAAVGSEDGHARLHRLRESKLDVVKARAPKLAEMTIALSTLDKNGGGLRWHLEHSGFSTPEIDELVEELPVKVLTLQSLFQKHKVGSIGVFQIDIEGQDACVLQQLIALCQQHEELWPRAIMYESDYDGCNSELYQQVRAQLLENGFHPLARDYTGRSSRDRVFVRFKAPRADGEMRRTGPLCCSFLRGCCSDWHCPFWHLAQDQAGEVPCSMAGRRHQCWRDQLAQRADEAAGLGQHDSSAKPIASSGEGPDGGASGSSERV